MLISASVVVVFVPNAVIMFCLVCAMRNILKQHTIACHVSSLAACCYKE
jgi:hypothetical protein